LVEGFEAWYEDNFEAVVAKTRGESPKKSTPAGATAGRPNGKTFRDPAMDEDEEAESDEE
jgi:hypothetical protein